MADEKISGLPAATVPLSGTELLPIVQGGTTKKVSAQDVANLAGAPETNGVAASVTNSSDIVHAYTVDAAALTEGKVITYTAEIQITADGGVGDEFPTYTMQLMLGATPYDFSTEQFLVNIDENADNTRGNVLGRFQLVTIDSVQYITGRFEIGLYNPDSAYFTSYANTQFIQQPFAIGTDDFSIESSIASPSTTITTTITGSSLTVAGAA